jgi:hypothetical protein
MELDKQYSEIFIKNAFSKLRRSVAVLPCKRKILIINELNNFNLEKEGEDE